MTTTRTVRQRSCIACGKLAGKAELMRIVRDPSGAVSFDKTGRAPGRGAYVCRGGLRRRMQEEKARPGAQGDARQR